MKIGTRVYDCRYGWGLSFEYESNDYPIGVNFKNGVRQSYILCGRSMIGEGKFLSLTEYNFIDGGFTPIDSEPSLEVGDMAYGWDDEEDDNLSYGVINRIDKNKDYQFRVGNATWVCASKEIPQWFIDKNKL
jgi:hypothetical protein